MEGLFVPLLSVLVILASSILKSRAQRSNKGTAPQKKRSITEMGRELIKQIEEAADQNTSSTKKPPLAGAKTMPKTSQSDGRSRLRTDSKVDAKNKSSQTRGRVNEIKIPDDQKTESLLEKRKPSSGLAIKSQLNKAGLRQSIVMAEVLGPPRAKKPHGRIR